MNSGIILPQLVAAVHPSGLTFFSSIAGFGALRPRSLPEILRGKLIPLQHCVAEAAGGRGPLFALLRLPYCVRHRNIYKVPQVKTGNGFALSQ